VERLDKDEGEEEDNSAAAKAVAGGAPIKTVDSSPKSRYSRFEGGILLQNVADMVCKYI
jgi:hypothetical protein